MQTSKMERLKYLVEVLNKASKAYYAEDREIMSNFEYDKLYDELVSLEQELGMVLANSPTVNVGFEAVDELPKEPHESPRVLSAQPQQAVIIKKDNTATQESALTRFPPIRRKNKS